MSALSILKHLMALLPLFLTSSVGAAQIVAKISHGEVTVGQPFQLFLEAKGELTSTPDLSVLHQAFEILARSQFRSSQVINGQSFQTLNLRLTLRPRTSGRLTIPAIRFGNDQSQPITLEVMGSSQPTPAQPAPLTAEPRAQDSIASIPYQATTVTGQRTAEPSAKPVDQSAADTTPWRWIALILALGWALTAGLWVASRRSQGSRPTSMRETRLDESAPQQSEPSALEIALSQVEAARTDQDAERTKQALLEWARLRWPEDPPGSLKSLAQRCPTDIRRGILEFERALYSPKAEPWFNQPVWQRLAEITIQPHTSKLDIRSD